MQENARAIFFKSFSGMDKTSGRHIATCDMAEALYLCNVKT